MDMEKGTFSDHDASVAIWQTRICMYASIGDNKVPCGQRGPMCMQCLCTTTDTFRLTWKLLEFTKTLLHISDKMTTSLYSFVHKEELFGELFAFALCSPEINRGLCPTTFIHENIHARLP